MSIDRIIVHQNMLLIETICPAPTELADAHEARSRTDDDFGTRGEASRDAGHHLDDPARQ